jgi:hypothetical protein
MVFYYFLIFTTTFFSLHTSPYISLIQVQLTAASNIWDMLRQHYGEHMANISFDTYAQVDEDVRVESDLTDAEIIRKVTENKGEIEENSSEEESECPTQNAPSLAAALAAISVLRDYCTAHNVEDLEITKIEDAIFASRMKTTKQSKLTDYFSKL